MTLDGPNLGTLRSYSCSRASRRRWRKWQRGSFLAMLGKDKLFGIECRPGACKRASSGHKCHTLARRNRPHTTLKRHNYDDEVPGEAQNGKEKNTTRKLRINVLATRSSS